MIVAILPAFAALAVVVTLPIWPYSADWGYLPRRS
ncbi:MAG TPA: DUF3309 family protein [Thermoleophilia bacterium]|nr:DUF3309 family protein [Thermoleophilia bacterium]